MSEPMCGAAAFLRPGRPAQVPFKPCCAAAILHAGRHRRPTWTLAAGARTIALSVTLGLAAFALAAHAL